MWERRMGLCSALGACFNCLPTPGHGGCPGPEPPRHGTEPGDLEPLLPMPPHPAAAPSPCFSDFPPSALRGGAELWLPGRFCPSIRHAGPAPILLTAAMKPPVGVDGASHHQMSTSLKGHGRPVR